MGTTPAGTPAQMDLITGVLLTHATTGRPHKGDWEYVLWAIGTGILHAHHTPRNT